MPSEIRNESRARGFCRTGNPSPALVWRRLRRVASLWSAVAMWFPPLRSPPRVARRMLRPALHSAYRESHRLQPSLVRLSLRVRSLVPTRPRSLTGILVAYGCHRHLFRRLRHLGGYLLSGIAQQMGNRGNWLRLPYLGAARHLSGTGHVARWILATAPSGMQHAHDALAMSIDAQRCPSTIAERFRCYVHDGPKRSAPNTSLKLTRRAALSGMLESPAGRAYSPGSLARFRRAA